MEGKKGRPTSIDEYIAQFPADVQQILAKIRAVIREAAPGATEKISYQMPAFYLKGGLIWFGAYKHHIGIYPKTAGMADLAELSGYKGTKGAVHLPLDQPIPYDLVRQMVMIRLGEEQDKMDSAPHTGYVKVGHLELYTRAAGQGPPIIVLHGGPDFNHSYFLPEMDRLSDTFRLIYYDQRGRGKSARGVQPEEVRIETEIEDLEAVRKYFQLKKTAVLGHSWGGLLAMEYALRHPERVSHLILMNTAPACHDDYILLRQDRLKKAAGALEQMKAIAASAIYQAGDVGAEAEYYRLHFSSTLPKPERLERVVRSLRVDFTEEDILQARAIEKLLMEETWLSREYNLLPKLRQLNVPTLLLHGDTDLVPVECASHIAQAVPGARLSVLSDTGHFSFLERPDEVRKEIVAFLGGTAG